MYSLGSHNMCTVTRCPAAERWLLKHVSSLLLKSDE